MTKRVITKHLEKHLIDVSMFPDKNYVKTYFQVVNDTIEEYINEFQDKLTGEDKAKSLHDLFDRLIEQEITQSDNLQKNKISCKKGCNHCCSQIVMITEDEAELLAKDIKDKGIKFSKAKLLRQSKVTSPEEWMKLKDSDRKCVFLGKGGVCEVYENRPAFCRSYFVVSDPKYCKTNAEHNVAMVFLRNVHTAISASLNLSEKAKNGENISLPSQLLEVIKK